MQKNYFKNKSPPLIIQQKIKMCISQIKMEKKQ